GNLDVLFSAAGGARRTNVLIGVATGSDDRRIAAASREFERESAGGGAAGNFTFVVKGGAMDGAGRWKQNTMDGGQAQFRFDADLGGLLFEASDTLLPEISLRRR